jgi:hypothetical protein
MQKKPLARAFQRFERRILRDRDSLAEQGGLETSVSREVFPKENPREYWKNFSAKFASIVQRTCRFSKPNPRAPKHGSSPGRLVS